ncbi:hypothetical protein IV203_038510 [Nitzschia inconspicua]|uniref:Arb2 domain-containing protein n=1 Tax=Nitzschia inconspicua TaxID=303405 RepID=A0A9K3PZ31_9STRA|nr:hypothetical protein IV203_038510 [Nitzschia inconspicua]
MGIAHSVDFDSCSSANEGRKDELFRIPSQHELAEYNEMEQRAAAQYRHHHHPKQKQHPPPNKSLPRAIPDANRSVQRKLGVLSGNSNNHHNDNNNNNMESATSPISSPSSPRFRRHKNRHSQKVEDTTSGNHEDDHHHGKLSSSFTRLRQKSVRRVRQASSSMLGKVMHTAGAVGHSSRRLFHHGNHSPHNNNNHNGHHRKSHRTGPITNTTIAPKVRGGVLLRGCYTDEEHKEKTREIVELLRPLQGAQALEACGLEFRSVKLNEQGHVIEEDEENETETMGNLNHDTQPPILIEEDWKTGTKENNESDHKLSKEDTPGNSRIQHDNDDDCHDCTCPSEGEKQQEPTNPQGRSNTSFPCQCRHSANTMTRLFHKETNTMITMNNRKEFIADGDMYDAIARVTQEYAQEIMARDGDLEWMTIDEAGNNPEPIRALASKRLIEDESMLDRGPTLLIATGKGKVRAGIFSRQHLLMSGLECSTALPIVWEARKRNMMVVMVDPNVHGDRLGMTTFEKSMGRLFRRWESNENVTSSPLLSQRDLFVLSHSQSGAQLARYLLDKSEHYIPHIRAVAFTDSTHNIQWAKSKNVAGLREFLESDDCIYFKCSKDSNNDPILNPLSSVGKEVETDDFWKHRFGNIKTLCAGTSEHALTNWFARCHIWEHFDKRLPNVETVNQETEGNEPSS